MAEALGRCCLIGAATGLRSQCGLAATAWTAATAGAPSAGRVLLARPWVRRATLAAAAAEMVADKSPRVPSRLSAVGLGPRLLLGGATAVLVSRRSPSAPSPVLAAATGASAALASAYAGSRGRRAAVRRVGTDVVGAVVEDLVAVALAWDACTSAAGAPDGSP